MTQSFIDAQRAWTDRLNEYINKRSSKGKVSERVQILLTVPKGSEQEFKDLAKAKRQAADSAISSKLDRLSLSLEFEQANPPPKRSDYE